MNQEIIRPRYRFRVPRNFKSREATCESKVEFKNLTNDVVFLYWIDYEGKPKFYAELNPINRLDTGLQITSFVSHPWVAILPGKIQGQLNGKRFFSPPNPNTWIHNKNGWLNNRWVLPRRKRNNSESNEDDCYFEVLVLKPGKIFPSKV